MAAGYTSFEEFLSKSSSDFVSTSSDDRNAMQEMNVEMNALRIELKAAKDALSDEKHQRLKDRKVYEAKVKEIKTIYNDYVLKLKTEHEAKLDILENDYETNLKILQEFESPAKSSRCHQFQQTKPVPFND